MGEIKWMLIKNNPKRKKKTQKTQRREWEKIVQEVLDLSCSVNRKSMASALRVLTYFSFNLQLLGIFFSQGSNLDKSEAL